MSVLNCDCIDGMRMFEDNCFDSIVCDPPYELGFMGKTWDSSGIAYSVEMWCEALRVLKPGGHLLAFSGSRTYHRMACAIEDAGFDIRDQIMWVYGSGFPKSLDVSKAIDKAAGHSRATEYEPNFANATFGKGLGGVMLPAASEPAVTAAARQWDGWGTALKPAHEPICVARKPLVGTVAANVQAWGTGAINVDACRVGSDVITTIGSSKQGTAAFGDYAGMTPTDHVGRWPANLIHDGSEEVVTLFPNSNGSGAARGLKRSELPDNGWGGYHTEHQSTPRDAGTGSAARFFYCAKASRADRGAGNIHPTVKPSDLMRYLCRLVTPPGGVVLDPFAGSGSTGKAAKLEGFRFIGMELSAEYTTIANARIDAS